MSKQVSVFVVERLHSWRIKRIFGYPGDGINGVMGALDRAKHSMEFVLVPHEELASFMACAHAEVYGRSRRLHDYLRAGRHLISQFLPENRYQSHS